MTHTLLTVFAHPDDETFSMGGTLASLAARGVRTVLYTATDGAAGRASGVDVASAAELGRLRRRELLLGAAVLGVDAVFMPGLPDGALAACDPDALVADIVACIRRVRPQVVVTFGPEGAPNRHRDHRAISRAVTAAWFLSGTTTACPGTPAAALAPFRPARLFYFTWGREIRDHYGVEGQPASCRVDTRRWHGIKRDAFEQHRTQWQHRANFEATLTPTEDYALVAGAPCPDGCDDLFGGLSSP